MAHLLGEPGTAEELSRLGPRHPLLTEDRIVYMECLGVFAASPRFGGLAVTEFDPDHADEEGALATALAQGIADVLAPG